MRKCGKSTLLRVLFRDHLLKQNIPANHIISIALDDRINQKLRNPDVLLAYIRQQVKDNQLYFILMDEIQMVDEFMDVLNSLLHIEKPIARRFTYEQASAVNDFLDMGSDRHAGD